MSSANNRRCIHSAAFRGIDYPRRHNTPEPQNASPEPFEPCRHFIINITNFPNLVQRTYHLEQQTHMQGVLMSGIPIHFGMVNTEAHERLLYNTLQFEIQEAVRAYLHRTQRTYPIYFVINMSGMEAQ